LHVSTITSSGRQILIANLTLVHFRFRLMIRALDLVHLVLTVVESFRLSALFSSRRAGVEVASRGALAFSNLLVSKDVYLTLFTTIVALDFDLAVLNVHLFHVVIDGLVLELKRLGLTDVPFTLLA
jgi:hypothetical protein